MKKKNALIVATLMVAIVSVLVMSSFQSAPQVKGYEYLTITQTGVSWLSVAIANGAYTEEKLNLAKSEMSLFNTRPVLNKVMTFEKEGWELVQVSHQGIGAGGVYHLADMRRPLP